MSNFNGFVIIGFDGIISICRSNKDGRIFYLIFTHNMRGHHYELLAKNKNEQDKKGKQI